MRSLALLLVAAVITGCLTQAPPANPPKSNPVQSEILKDVDREEIRFETDLGVIDILLYPEAAPKTVELMKTYVAEKYYDDREFGRPVPGHVIQIVDKTGGCLDDARRVPLETNGTFHFSAGAAGIARSADPNSGGPEFFIMDYATSSLDGNYTVWGQAIDGIDVIHRAARVQAISPPPEANPPVDVPAPVCGAGPIGFDSYAVTAATIKTATLTTVHLAGTDWAQYPMKVAKNVRVGDMRHSLDYPRDLAPGRESRLNWYIRPYSNSPLPVGPYRVHADGKVIPATASSDADGALGWAWTPAHSGPQNVTLSNPDGNLATLRVVVA